MLRILFVCHGNIVRSPLAEHLFRLRAQQSGVESRFEVASAGMNPRYSGVEYDELMIKIAAEHGVHYAGSSRVLAKGQLERCDLILALDREVRAALVAKACPETRPHIHLLREYDPQGGPLASVPDPFAGDEAAFRRVFEMISRSVDGLLKTL
jgi:protein-tyrosine phosphatase